MDWTSLNIDILTDCNLEKHFILTLNYRGNKLS